MKATLATAAVIFQKIGKFTFFTHAYTFTFYLFLETGNKANLIEFESLSGILRARKESSSLITLVFHLKITETQMFTCI